MSAILRIATFALVLVCFPVTALLAQPVDTDGDGIPNTSDLDDDNDGVADAADHDPLDPHVCRDVDGDTCDDCTIGTDGYGPASDARPGNDGPDADADGLCDDGDTGDLDTDGDGIVDTNDPDDDNDGVADSADLDRLDPHVCRDADLDTCDDCTIGTDGYGPLSDALPGNDGPDGDADGVCDDGDTGGGPDTDGDGIVDTNDPDDDNDGVADAADHDPLDPHVCRDVDADTCDDCTIGTDGYGPASDALPGNDGPDGDADGVCDGGEPGPPDTDGDGIPNVNDSDDDNDGVTDTADDHPLDPSSCTDDDDDTCDDCSIGTDGFGPLADNLTDHDGPDGDDDGLCDAGDPCTDRDFDTICDAVDNCSSIPNAGQSDIDADGFGDACDCGPTDATVHPAAIESNDGRDNQCSGDPGHGLVDEVGGDYRFPSRLQLCWLPQPNATGYKVMRSSSTDCGVVVSPSACAAVTDAPAAGDVHYYLVQAASPHVGSWGADSEGHERFPSCP